MERESRARERAGMRVTYLSLWVNLGLGLVKIWVGWFGSSRALIADGLHSLTDLSTDFATVFALRMAETPRDDNHPYGHHKFSNLVQLLIGVAILGFCFLLIMTSVHELRRGVVLQPSLVAFFAALGCLVVKEWLFRKARGVAREHNSGLLLANAWHHRTDSFSSAVVALAILAAWLGGPAWAFLDSVAGILLGGYLSIEGFKLIRQALFDLLDTAPHREIVDDLREHILPTPGVRAYHAFRARRVGDMYEVDVHIQVDSSFTVETGHRVAKAVKENILHGHPEVIDVLVHVEPALANYLKEVGFHDREPDLRERP